MSAPTMHKAAKDMCPKHEKERVLALFTEDDLDTWLQYRDIRLNRKQKQELMDNLWHNSELSFEELFGDQVHHFLIKTNHTQC